MLRRSTRPAASCPVPPVATRLTLSLLCLGLASAGCQGPLFGASGTSGGGCLTDRQFFAQKVWAQVISKTCIKCHSPDGVAAAMNAKLLLLTAGYPGFLDANLATFSEVAKTEYDHVSEILLKPTGKLTGAAAHGGGQVIEEGSAEYQILDEMIKRAARPNTFCPGGTDTAVGATQASLSLLPPVEALRKASLALAGRLPSEAEKQAVRVGGETALATAVDGLMKEEAFLSRIKEIYDDLLLTNQYAGNGLDLLNGDDYPGRTWWNPDNLPDNKLTDAMRQNRLYSTTAIGGESLELIAHVVRENRPFTEILTADYTMVNPYSARVYGLDPATLGFVDSYAPYEFREAKVQIARMGMKLPLPHAGLLTQPVFLNRYSTTDTNLNRHRARFAFKLFLATDILAVAERPIDPSSVTSTNPTRDDQYCKVCHKMIDPVAGTFQKFDANGRFMPDAMWPTAMPQPGFGLASINDVGMYPEALQWLATQLTADRRFVAAAVQTMYRGFAGQEPLAYPADPSTSTDPMAQAQFAAALAAWQEQDAAFQAISAAFVADKYNLKTLVRQLVLGPVFRASNATSAASAAASLEGYGTGRLLLPSSLARKIAATVGFHWWRYDNNDWLNTDYNLLYGGIDDVSVTTRLTVPNGIMVNVALRMAEEVSCQGTAWDFTKPRAQRVLFPLVERSYRPEDDNGYPVPEAVAGIRANIRYLHSRLLGEELSDDDPEIERTYQLFLKTYRELFQSGVPDLPWDCQGRWERTTGVALTAGIIDRDPNYTIRAWMAVMTYLLSDWKYLYE